MAWLIVCPSHRTGLLGLIFFFVILYYQPNLHANYFKNIGGVESSETNLNNRGSSLESVNYFKTTFSYIYHPTTVQLEMSHMCTFFVFFGSILYVCTFLPFGRFYNRVGGNVTMLYAYLYIFVYLSIPELKKVLVPLYVPGLKSRIVSNLHSKGKANALGEA
jgi:hypothetical protein